MFYLWPKGRVVRICVMVLGALIAADLAYHGAYGSLSTAFDPQAGSGARRQLILGCVYAALALIALGAGLISAGPHKRAVQFLIDVEDEMTKVEWPQPGQLWRSTLVVALAIAVIAGVVFITDLALYHGLEFIQKR
jgi:preprotein translocase SecE subunit